MFHTNVGVHLKKLYLNVERVLLKTGCTKINQYLIIIIIIIHIDDEDIVSGVYVVVTRKRGARRPCIEVHRRTRLYFGAFQ